MRKLSTGEPCAGEPLARFGGSGESGKTLLYPYTTAWADILLHAKSAFPTSLWVMQEVEQRRSGCREAMDGNTATDASITCGLPL